MSNANQASGAKTITTDEVLETLKIFSSQDLRSYQSKLTSLNRTLRALLEATSLEGRIGQLLSPVERDALRQTNELIGLLNTRVEHAKEKKLRAEKQAKAARKANELHASRLANEAFPLPIETIEQKLELIQFALVMNRAGLFMDYVPASEYSMRLREMSSPNVHNASYWSISSKIRLLRSEVLAAINTYILGYSDQSALQANLVALQSKCTQVRPQVLELEANTLRIWSEALSVAAHREVK